MPEVSIQASRTIERRIGTGGNGIGNSESIVFSQQNERTGARMDQPAFLVN